VAGKLAERAYAQNAEAGEAAQPEAEANDDVVDAEFEEVDDDKKISLFIRQELKQALDNSDACFCRF
jgi:hypothetical protein